VQIFEIQYPGVLTHYIEATEDAEQNNKNLCKVIARMASYKVIGDDDIVLSVNLTLQAAGASIFEVRVQERYRTEDETIAMGEIYDLTFLVFPIEVEKVR
jgi:hypothetical protein